VTRSAQPDLATHALASWNAGYRHRGSAAADVPVLEPPAGLTVVASTGHVHLTWAPVDDAVGYLVHRRAAGEDELRPVDHHGGDVLAVPDRWYVDTTGSPGTTYEYAVATLASVDVVGPTGPTVEAAALPSGAHQPVVTVCVDASGSGTPLPRPWQPMIGSERLSQLLCTDLSGGREIGVELLAALRRVRDEIGVEFVRAHSVFDDDLAVYHEVDGKPVIDFTGVDAVYDLLRDLGLRPTVEIGFMPRDLASDPSKTIFEYAANVSPPKDWDRWYDLVHQLVAHLVDRYGLDEVLGWDFEVWNEANLEVFWSGTREEWLHLYDVTAAAAKAVDPRLSVGGPSSAAAGWVDDLLGHAQQSGAAVDFVSTHTYGSAPLDLRPTLERYGYPGARLLWTEWGVTPTHFHEVSDGTSAGTFLLSGMRSAAGRVDALSYWVASDHFEELGRPPRLLHGGFGLLTVGGIAKPRYHALRMLASLGETELPVTYEGDGGGGLVQAWASRHADGRLTIVLWNHTLDQARRDGSPDLARTVRLTLPGVGHRAATITRLDRENGDITTLGAELGIGDWPDSEQWAALRAVDTLAPEPVQLEASADGAVLEIALPQPGAVLVEIPAPAAAARLSGAAQP